LKLKYDDPLSKFAFNCNLRQYIKVLATTALSYAADAVVTVLPITLGVYDAGYNYVGTANYITKAVFANVTGGPATADGAPAYAQLTEQGQNMVSSL